MSPPFSSPDGTTPSPARSMSWSFPLRPGWESSPRQEHTVPKTGYFPRQNGDRSFRDRDHRGERPPAGLPDRGRCGQDSLVLPVTPTKTIAPCFSEDMLPTMPSVGYYGKSFPSGKRGPPRAPLTEVMAPSTKGIRKEYPIDTEGSSASWPPFADFSYQDSFLASPNSRSSWRRLRRSPQSAKRIPPS